MVVAPGALRDVLKHCQGELEYDFLVDVASLDHMGEDPRFEMVYELATINDAKHLRVRSKVPDDAEVPTVADLWATANWHEREAWDLMGIRFAGHPDLRRMLLEENWVGHPLRKDYQMPSQWESVSMEGQPYSESPFPSEEPAEPAGDKPAED